jgi:hypothetical protein
MMYAMVLSEEQEWYNMRYGWCWFTAWHLATFDQRYGHKGYKAQTKGDA